MTDAAATRRAARKSFVPAGVAAGVVFGLLTVPALFSSGSAPRVDGPVFPAQVASYSWFTSPLMNGEMDAATVAYQNGVGVEFMDGPQAVVLGADGTTYRRFLVAEGLTIPADQGDPADMLLSADGTFIVVAGAGNQGAVEVVTLRGGSSRSVPIGEGRSGIPVSISADGASVVLLLSDEAMSPYNDFDFRLYGTLALLDLETGALTEFGLTDVQSAAISPDGARIAATVGPGIRLVDVATGSVSDTALDEREAYVDDDAWAPDGGRFAMLIGDELRIVDVTATEPVVSSVTVPGIEYGSAIGWRDADTVLIHAGAPGDNASQFAWVDAATGAREMFSTYAPDFTGAALAGPDVARDLVATWAISPASADRGIVPVILAAVAAGFVGLLAWGLTPRRRAVRAEAERPASPVSDLVDAS